MPILEPMTVLTDYILAALGLILGLRLWRGTTAWGSSRRLWAASLLAMAVAALAGGTAHGFADRAGAAGHWVLWRITVWAIGVASLSLAAAAARFALSKRAARTVCALFGLQFAIYAVWMLWHDSFAYVLLEYLPAMVFVLAVASWQWSRRGWPGGPWVVAGILVSFLAAGIQASGLTLHRHFNHNDLYHVVQMVGVYLLYRGGALLSRAEG
ncbi:MAG: hypothetical protein ACE5GX_06825 [Thermoanaerobaculia bacterium]